MAFPVHRPKIADAQCHWTPRELADEIMKQEIIGAISIRHAGRLLEEAELKPSPCSYWVNPPS
ncbi:MAG: hypothetical protein ACR9NN_21045 [Nostochopsis sp.]